jgi:hypothetical protein
MPEPLSILAAIATASSAAREVAKRTHWLIVAIREVPDELLALQNEINDFSAVLNQVESTYEASHDPGTNLSESVSSSDTAFSSEIHRAKVHLNELEAALEPYLEHENLAQLSKGARLRWIKRLRAVRALRLRIKESREKLCLWLHINSS